MDAIIDMYDNHDTKPMTIFSIDAILLSVFELNFNFSFNFFLCIPKCN